MKVISFADCLATLKDPKAKVAFSKYMDHKTVAIEDGKQMVYWDDWQNFLNNPKWDSFQNN